MKTKNKTCSKVVPQAIVKQCYNLEYNSGTWYTETLGDGSEEWMYFHTAAENNVTSTVRNYPFF